MDREDLRRLVRDHAELSFSRSGGPGGQNVNKRDTKATARFPLNALEQLGPGLPDRAARSLASRLTVDGVLIVHSETHRSQSLNREDALERLTDILSAALAPEPRPRKPSRPSRAARARRLDAKKRRGRLKAARRRPPNTED